MDFRLIAKLVTLNDHEQHNGRLRYSTEFASFGCEIIQKWYWLKVDLYCLQQKCSPTNLVLATHDLWQEAPTSKNYNLITTARYLANGVS